MSPHDHSATRDEDDGPDDHDLGLAHDLPRLRAGSVMARRGLLGLAGGLGLAAVAGCAVGSGSTTGPAASTADGGVIGGAPPDGGGSTVTVAEGEIPEETAGPYPGDGSNGPNVLTESGVVRSDITSSFGDSAGTADGVPLTIRLRVYDLNGTEATPLPGAAVYLWHCDREGNYSLYSEAAAGENYLRGVQEADADGRLEFTTIYPGCYSGRWPHVHFEVYESLDAATSASSRLRTSQLALPEGVSETVYATDGYEASVANLASISLDSDNVFADGYSLQMAAVTGSVEAGYVATLNVPV